MMKMRMVMPVAGVLVMAAAGLMLGADAAPKTVAAADILYGKVQLIGTLGKPFGTYMTISVTMSEPPTKQTQYVVDTIDGKKLAEPVKITIASPAPLDSQTHYIMRGYETAAIVGMPKDPLAKPVDPTMAVAAEPAFGFHTWFVATGIESSEKMK